MLLGFSGGEDQEEFALSQRSEKFFFSLLSLTHIILFQLSCTLYNEFYNIFAFLIITGELIKSSTDQKWDYRACCERIIFLYTLLSRIFV